MTDKPITIILVSDNHGMKEPLDTLKTMYPNADYFFHCGDSMMQAYELDGYAVVKGNCDYGNQFPKKLVLEVGEHRILLMHGNLTSSLCSYEELLAIEAKRNHCDIVMSGHTHVPHDITCNGIRLLNPGSIWNNRDGSLPSYMVVTLREKDVHAELKRYMRSSSEKRK